MSPPESLPPSPPFAADETPPPSSSIVPPITGDRQFRSLAVFVLLLGALALTTVRNLLAPVIIAAWFAGLTSPLVGRLSRRLGGRQRVAALATVVLILFIVAPVVLLALPVSGMVADIGRAAIHSPPNSLVRQAIDAMAGAGQSSDHQGATGVFSHSIERVVQMGREVAPSAAALLSSAFDVVASVFVQLFILAVSAYYFAAQGGEIMRRLRQGSPLAPTHFQRLVREFMDVARAMLMGSLLTALAQGVVAGVVYALVGVPHVFVLAVITGFVSLLPSLGSAIAWVPICIVLVAAGRVRDALVLAVCGVLFISSVDNVLRPFFSKLGADRVHPLLMFLGIFGGLEAFGGWGLILGPLALSLFVASYRLFADESAARRELLAAWPVAPDESAPPALRSMSRMPRERVSERVSDR